VYLDVFRGVLLVTWLPGLRVSGVVLRGVHLMSGVVTSGWFVLV
jgi:hypothetical protein